MDGFSLGWVSHYGVPSSITTDRGMQFLSNAWSQLMQTWGIRSHTTTAYHPEANGLVERFHRRLKESLLAASHDKPNEWYWQLPAVLLSIRTTLKPDIGASPAEMVYGEPISIPGTLLSDLDLEDDQLRQQRAAVNDLRVEVARLQPMPTSAHRKQRVQLPDNLREASHVFIRKAGVQPCFAAPYSGPYRVVSRKDTYFKVAMPGRGTESVALARIKPANIEADDPEGEDLPAPVTPPSPPRPGRPPGWRSRPPAPTDRRTRQQDSQDAPLPPEDSDDFQSSSSSHQMTPRRLFHEPNDAEAPSSSSDTSTSGSSQSAPSSCARTAPFARRQATTAPDAATPSTSGQAIPLPAPSTSGHAPSANAEPRAPRFFTTPAERRFSAKGSGRINYAAPLRALLNATLF